MKLKLDGWDLGITFSACHFLPGHDKCNRLHGHNYRAEVTVAGSKLDDSGMLVDFGWLKQICQRVVEELDHSLLNEHPFFQQNNPTAENISHYLYTEIAERLNDTEVSLEAVRVWESATSSATYRED